MRPYNRPAEIRPFPLGSAHPSACPSDSDRPGPGCEISDRLLRSGLYPPLPGEPQFTQPSSQDGRFSQASNLPTTRSGNSVFHPAASFISKPRLWNILDPGARPCGQRSQAAEEVKLLMKHRRRPARTAGPSYVMELSGIPLCHRRGEGGRRGETKPTTPSGERPVATVRTETRGMLIYMTLDPFCSVQSPLSPCARPTPSLKQLCVWFRARFAFRETSAPSPGLASSCCLLSLLKAESYWNSILKKDSRDGVRND